MMDPTTSECDDQAAEQRGALRWLAREIFGIFFVAALLFGISGRWGWVGAWLTVALYAVWVTANAVLLMPRCPSLLAERARRKMGPHRADNIILSIYGVAVMAKYVAAALEVRLGGSGSFGPPVMTAGLLISALGYALVTWAMVANAFFSMVLRIQEERGQLVVKSGPYAFIRHPGYLGSALFELGTPFLLGSTWAIGFGLLSAVLMVVRTAVEDRVLQRDLPGYSEYARLVRWRLIPGLW